MKRLAVLACALALLACWPFVNLVPTPTPTQAPTPTQTPTITLPPIVGPDPSTRVAAYYYPWYGNPDVDTHWVHWEEGGFTPPLDISSDFYPILGAYSANDRAVVAQHFAWLRQAGAGVVISSWWGRDSFDDRALPLLLDQADRYGIQVAIHLEPYSQRNAQRMLDDIRYLYERYGDHPAFYRTTGTSPWIRDERPKGLFFVFAPGYAGEAEPEVQAEYWQHTLDAIHALPDGAILVASTTDCSWVERGHFDGLYNYIHVHLEEENVFNWSRCIPSGAWYVPSVIPGNSPNRIGYPEDLYEPRRDGETYIAQWEAALGTGVQPHLVAVTSFNEWHEGTQIEPAAYGISNGRGYNYDDYGPLGEQGYLTLTRQWVDRFSTAEWPPTPVMRLHITTTADWTSLLLLSGGTWLQPETISASEEATVAAISGNRINLNQPLDRARGGGQVELVMDVGLLDVGPEGVLAFEIQRGSIGWTRVELFNLTGTEPVLAATTTWGGIAGADGLNPYSFSLQASTLVSATEPDGESPSQPTAQQPLASPAHGPRGPYLDLRLRPSLRTVRGAATCRTAHRSAKSRTNSWQRCPNSLAGERCAAGATPLATPRAYACSASRGGVE